MKCGFLLFTFLLALCISQAEASLSASISADVDKKTIIIGDDIIYSVSVNFPPGYTFNQPDFKSILSNFEVRSQKTEKKKNKVEYGFVLTSYTTGEVRINSFEVDFNSPLGGKEKVIQNGIAIAVRFLEPREKDTSEIRDIKPPIIPQPGAWTYVILTLLIAACAYYFIFRKKITKPLTSHLPSEPVLAPEEIANRMFEELAAKKLVEQGLIKEFYIELSGIIRTYLSAKYGIPVIERTTDELFADLKKIIPKKMNMEIKEFLESCDLVKFAKYLPELNESRDDLVRAKNIVNVSQL